MVIPINPINPIRVKHFGVGLQILNIFNLSTFVDSAGTKRKLSSDQHIGSNILVKYELSRSQSKALIKSASTERLCFHTNLISSLQLLFPYRRGKKTTKIVKRLSQTSFLNKTPLEKFKSQEESCSKRLPRHMRKMTTVDPTPSKLNINSYFRQTDEQQHVVCHVTPRTKCTIIHRQSGTMTYLRFISNDGVIICFLLQSEISLYCH